MPSRTIRRRRAFRSSRPTRASRCSWAARKARPYSRSTTGARRSTSSRSGARSPTPSIGTPSSTARCSAMARRSAATFRRTARTTSISPAFIRTTSRKRARFSPTAGYPGGFSVSMKLPPPSYARRAGEIVAAQLAEVGIRVRIENLEWAQWLDQVFTRHDYDLSIVAHAEPMDYDIYARDDYYFGYSSAAFKALIAELDDSIDREGAQRPARTDPAQDHGRLSEWISVPVPAARGLERASAGCRVRQPARHRGLERCPLRRGRIGRESAHGARGDGIAARVLRWLALAGGALLMVLAARRFGAFFVGARLAILLATLIGGDGRGIRRRASGAGRPGTLHDGPAGGPAERGGHAPSTRARCAGDRALPALGRRTVARRFRDQLHLPRTGRDSHRRALAGVAAARGLRTGARGRRRVPRGVRRGAPGAAARAMRH